MGVYLGSHRVKLNRAMELRTDDSVLDSIIDRTISVYENPVISEIGSYAFTSCNSLTYVNLSQATTIKRNAFANCQYLTLINLPQVTSVGHYAFYRCSRLNSVNLPNATQIGMYVFTSCSSLTSINLFQATTIDDDAFGNCSNLISISLPQAVSIGNYAFASCSSLALVSLPKVTSIGLYGFASCYRLLSLYLMGSSVVYLSASAFISTPISDYTSYTDGVFGSIFVPYSLYNSYITDSNWSVYSARIVSR